MRWKHTHCDFQDGVCRYVFKIYAAGLSDLEGTLRRGAHELDSSAVVLIALHKVSIGSWRSFLSYIHQCQHTKVHINVIFRRLKSNESFLSIMP